MKISIQLNENLQVVNYCFEEHYNTELPEIIARDYPLGLIEIGETDPETLILQYYIDGVFYEQSLEEKRAEKLTALQNDFNASKKIVLQNGNTLTINHDTPERNFFTDNLENLKRIEQAENSVLSYRQKVDNVYLGFSALSYIWKHLFLNKFTNERPSLTLEAKREKNKETYDVKKVAIENATSIQELEGINWSFEDITIININVEAQNLIDDPQTPAYVVDAINALKGEDGQIHLIEPL